MKDAMVALRDAITQYDVGATIADDDVDKWNSVIKAEKELRVLIISGDRGLCDTKG